MVLLIGNNKKSKFTVKYDYENWCKRVSSNSKRISKVRQEKEI